MQGVSHYENFPVASWLCPARLRPAVAAIYHFARTADDIADEGSASAGERLSQLSQYRESLVAAAAGQPPKQNRWSGLFAALGLALEQHQLPASLLHDLLDAFEQDIRYTAAGQRYQSLAELLDYCTRSANPVGRLLLHLYRVTDTTSLNQSDQICTALQLTNFWQDLRQDLSRQRYYLPQDLLAQFGVSEHALNHTLPDSEADAAAKALLAHLVQDARTRMLSGAPLALRVPGRAGWELRLVVQGGLRILEKIEFHDYRSWLHRPKLRPSDVGLMLWRSCRMHP